MSKELEKKSEELEQTLAKQLNVFKKGSEDWVKVGAVVAVSALVVYGVVQLTNKKKRKEHRQSLGGLGARRLTQSRIEATNYSAKAVFAMDWISSKNSFLGPCSSQG